MDASRASRGVEHMLSKAHAMHTRTACKLSKQNPSKTLLKQGCGVIARYDPQTHKGCCWLKFDSLETNARISRGSVTGCVCVWFVKGYHSTSHTMQWTPRNVKSGVKGKELGGTTFQFPSSIVAFFWMDG